MRVIAIHQPNYLPWLGFFQKLWLADVFVLLDNAPYSKGSYLNRVRIKGPNGAHWLTQAVATAGKLGQSISELRFASDDWAAKHLQAIRAAYGRCAHFREHFAMLEELLLSNSTRSVAECNVNLVKAIAKLIGARAEIQLASSVGSATGTATARLVELTRAFGGDTYLCGTGGRTQYQDNLAFLTAGLNLYTLKRPPEAYPQAWGEFVGGLSILDILLNCGADIARAAAASATRVRILDVPPRGPEPR